MKSILFTIFVMFGINTLAASSNENYCADENKKVFLVRATDQNPLHHSDVDTAEIVGFLPSGNIILLTCPGTGVIPKRTFRQNFYIVDRTLVFIKTRGPEVGNFEAIGINPVNSKYLVQENSIVRRYYVVNKPAQSGNFLFNKNRRIINK
jgi:hypothetical protein